MEANPLLLSTMSYFYQPANRNQGAHYAQRTASTFSPSLRSVLSTELLSAREIDNQEWVLFSPQMVPTSDYSELSPSSELHMIHEDISDFDIEDTPRQSLELPAHNGAGSFDQHARRDLMERVNMWRLDQSQLVFSELQRLERKFFPTQAAEPVGEQDEFEAPDSVWSRIGHKVMENLQSFMHMDDEVLDVIFGHNFVDPEENADRQSDDEAPHSLRASLAGCEGWQDVMLSKLFGRKSSVSDWVILEKIASWTSHGRRSTHSSNLETLVHHNPCFTEASLDHRWEFETSSLSTQVF